MIKNLLVSIFFFLVPCNGLDTDSVWDGTFPVVPGWKLVQEEKVYVPENLFDVIDGAADLFLEYNFVTLHIGRYTKENLEVKVELYKHATAVDAFGMYSQERFGDYHFITVGIQGYIEKGALNFLSGSFYVKISTIQEGPAAQESMAMIARQVANYLKQVDKWPPMLAAFPDAQKIENSEQYIAKSFLGYSPLNAAYVASYNDGSPFKAFLIRFQSAAQAQQAVSAFLKALPQKAQRKESGGTTEVEDPNNGRIIFVAKGSDMYGVVSEGAEAERGKFLDDFGKRIASIR